MDGVENRERLPLDEVIEATGASLASLTSSLANRTDDPQTIFVTSPRGGCGCTVLSASLALSLVRNVRKRVTLVEANCYSPSLGSYLELGESPGILDVIDGHDAETAYRNSKVSGLYVLTSGANRVATPGDLHSQKASDLFDLVIGRNPITIVDSPPILDYPESRLLYRYATATILVVRAGQTRRSDARAALKVLEDTGVPALGMIVNGAKSGSSKGSS